jgi:hypothetical protein
MHSLSALLAAGLLFAPGLALDDCADLNRKKCLLTPGCGFTKERRCTSLEDLGGNSPENRDGPFPEVDSGLCPKDAKAASKSVKLVEKKTWQGKDLCNLRAPGEVVAFRVACEGATYLDFRIADCCIPGDHFQLRGRNWDRAPQTAVTTSPGGNGAYGVPARVYNYGGTSSRPGHMDALIECTYLHGVDIFSAGAYVHFESDGTGCVVERRTVDMRVDRSP